MLLNIQDTFEGLVNPILDFFKNICKEFYDFGLQYLPQDVWNVFIFIVGLGLVLVIILAVMNHK